VSGEGGVIEREIFIAASPEAVFSFLVDPLLMAEWEFGDCAWTTRKQEVNLINFLLADKLLVLRAPKDGRVQFRVACRKRDKGRQSGHRGQQ
jgi:hypothetical protein